MISAFCDENKSMTKKMDYEVVSLVNLGCCYHLLTEKGGQDWTDRGTIIDDTQQVDKIPSANGLEDNTEIDKTFFGFPMSQFLRNSNLGLHNRMVACQAPKQWQADIPSKANSGLESIRRLHYRSVLEKIMKEFNIHPPYVSSYDALKATSTGERAIKKLGVKDCTDPITYTHAALKRLGCTVPDQLTEGTIRGTFEWYSNAKEQIAEVWALRCMLGDVIESLILVDRCLKVEESGFEVDLVSICEPGDSPRNMAVTIINNSSNNNSNKINSLV